MSHQWKRRADSEPVVVGRFDDGCNRYFDEVSERVVIKLISGKFYVTHERTEMIITILGSCISACMHDAEAGVGGMNHFLLPDAHEERDGESLRFGAFAMEQLLNALLAQGAQKERLQVKVFGGGAVVGGLSDVGKRNISFVRQFLQDEGLSLVAEDVGGTLPRRIHYYPESGRVRVRKLRREEDRVVIDKEKLYAESLAMAPVEGGVELFG